MDTPDTDELEAARQAKLAEMGAPVNVVTGDERIQVDYFGFEETHRVALPDGVSYVEHKTLNEGARRKYLNSVNRDLVINRNTNDARLRTAPGDDRHALLKSAICGWNIVRGGEPLKFTSQNLDLFLDKYPPHIVDLVEKDVRAKNLWLTAEVTVEDIDAEIAELTELREQKIRETEGNGGSSS